MHIRIWWPLKVIMCTWICHVHLFRIVSWAVWRDFLMLILYCKTCMHLVSLGQPLPLLYAHSTDQPLVHVSTYIQLEAYKQVYTSEKWSHPGRSTSAQPCMTKVFAVCSLIEVECAKATETGCLAVRGFLSNRSDRLSSANSIASIV